MTITDARYRFLFLSSPLSGAVHQETTPFWANQWWKISLKSFLPAHNWEYPTRPLVMSPRGMCVFGEKGTATLRWCHVYKEVLCFLDGESRGHFYRCIRTSGLSLSCHGGTLMALSTILYLYMLRGMKT